MNIVIPMAGEGKRFKDAGFENPKPLIDIAGESMIQRVIRPFRFLRGVHYHFICRKEYKDKYIEHHLRRSDNIIYPQTSISYVDKTTEGAACTVLTIKDKINNNEELLIADCDGIYDPLVLEILGNYIKTNPHIDSISLCFTNESPKNSFVKIGCHGFTIQVAEKQVISNLCCTGMHWFRKGKYFVEAAEAMIESNDRVNNEFYITPCLSYLIKKNHLHIPLLIPNQLFEQIGTSQDLHNYMNKLISHASI